MLIKECVYVCVCVCESVDYERKTTKRRVAYRRGRESTRMWLQQQQQEQQTTGLATLAFVSPMGPTATQVHQ